MTIMQRLSNWGEALPVPDAVSRMVIASLVGRTDRSLATGAPDAAAFAREMAAFPIAVHTDAANAQHITRCPPPSSPRSSAPGANTPAATTPTRPIPSPWPRRPRWP